MSNFKVVVGCDRWQGNRKPRPYQLRHRLPVTDGLPPRLHARPVRTSFGRCAGSTQGGCDPSADPEPART